MVKVMTLQAPRLCLSATLIARRGPGLIMVTTPSPFAHLITWANPFSEDAATVYAWFAQRLFAGRWSPLVCISPTPTSLDLV